VLQWEAVVFSFLLPLFLLLCLLLLFLAIAGLDTNPVDDSLLQSDHQGLRRTGTASERLCPLWG
jgi:hypothetical protein